jgi:phage virion morphogenesis protein
MADGLEDLERAAGALLASLSAQQRRSLLRRMARALQQSQARRIASQRNPDGTAFEGRKPQLRQRKGGVRRKAMFTSLRRARFLHLGSDDRSLWVGFSGRAARIASVHQYGLRDRPNLRAKAMYYPERRLLGPSEADSGMLLDMLYNHITKG